MPLILGTLHFAPSETESGQLVKGPASLKIDKLEGLTERIRIGTTGRSYQMHKKWVLKQVHTAAKLMASENKRPKLGITVSTALQIRSRFDTC